MRARHTTGAPGPPQERRPTADPRSSPPVELEPHPGLRDPWPAPPPVAGGVRLLGSSDRPSRRPLRALEPQREQLVVNDVGADLALRALDPLLDLGQEAVDQAVAPGSCRSDRMLRGSPRCPRPSSTLPSSPADSDEEQSSGLGRVPWPRSGRVVSGYGQFLVAVVIE